MNNYWIVDKTSIRIYGSKEFMERNLKSCVGAMLNATNEFTLRHYAIHAWHWALALQEEDKE